MVTGETTSELEDEDTQRPEEEERQGDNTNLTDTETDGRGYKGVHSFWWRGMACIFDVQNTAPNAARNTEAPPENMLEKNDKEEKNFFQEN